MRTEVRLTARLFSPTRRLIGAAFIMDLCAAMTMLAVQDLGIYRLNAEPFMLGLFGTAGSVTYTLGCLFTGTLSDRYGRRRCAILGCVGAAVGWWFLAQAKSAVTVLSLTPLVGLSASLFWPSLQAWLAELTEGGRRELSRNIGLFNILWSIGFMLGPVVTGYLWGVAPELTFRLPAALVLLEGIALALTPRGVRRDEPSVEEFQQSHEDGDRFLKLAWIGNFAAFFAGAIVMVMFPKLGVTLRFSDPTIGWVLFAYRMGQVAVFVWTRYEHRWQYRLWPLPLALGLAAVGSGVGGVTSNIVVFSLGFALVGACAGLTYVSSLFYSLHARPDGRARTSGFHEAVLGSGGFLGPLLGGIAAQSFTLHAPFFLGAAVLVLAVMAQLRLAAGPRSGH